MVRLYRSPSPEKRRFIENQSDINPTRSPICGAAVLGKIRLGKSGNSNNSNNNRSANNISPLPTSANRSQPEYVSILQASSAKKGLFGSAGSDFAYESIGSSTQGGRESPESTESSTSGASSHDADEDPEDFEQYQAPYALQFEPKLQQESSSGSGGNKEDNSNLNESDRLQLRMDRLQAWMAQQKQAESSSAQSQYQSSGSNAAAQMQAFAIRNRAHIFSAHLPVVTEERSFEMEDSSIASGGQSMKDERESPTKSVRSYSSPERNEMLLAMRQLVLKQQAALSEMAEENRHYRRDLQESHKLLHLAKEAYTKQQRQVENFMVEKESTEAEVMWLREEVKTLRAEIYKHQQEKKETWTSTKTSAEVEERLRRARAETPERKRTQPRSQIIEEPSPVRSPLASPRRQMGSAAQTWKLKSMLPEINYLSDGAESDEDLVREFQDLHSSLQNTGVSTKAIQAKLREHQMTAESRDDGKLSPSMWQDEDSKSEEEGPEDEMREWARSRSPVPASRRQSQEADPVRGRHFATSRSPVPRESSRTPSELSATGSSVSASSSAVSQRSREEVALFKSRLGAIQKKREHRKQIEENVGSRSGRVKFT